MSYWLGSMLVLLNGINWVVFMGFSNTSPEVRALSIQHRMLAGLFQGLSVRSGGFGIVSVRNLHVGIQLVYTVMLYISAFPLALPLHAAKPESVFEFVVRQARGLMRAGDLRYLASAVLIICVLEQSPSVDVFAVVFEVSSAFGCVGVSFGGVKDGRLALVGDWSGGSKMVLAAVMLWGRVREVRRGILKGWGDESGVMERDEEEDEEKSAIV